jgi:hypothetical protein
MPARNNKGAPPGDVTSETPADWGGFLVHRMRNGGLGVYREYLTSLQTGIMAANEPLLSDGF